MSRTKTSKKWMNEHVKDPFVQRATREGYRSRAAYKLLEIDKRDQLLKPGMIVVDLGATPGGWSQVAADKVGPQGKVIALDLLQLQPIESVEFIQGDFREDDIQMELEERLGGKKVGLVISDMSPNISGISVTDQARAMHLAELALGFAVRNLKPGGTFLVKAFQGVGIEDYVKLMRADFTRVLIRKPDSSRDRSNEIYLLGMEKIMGLENLTCLKSLTGLENLPGLKKDVAPQEPGSA